MTVASKKNFDLSREQFEELRGELRDGRETLFEHLFLTHFATCRDYLISKDKASPEDAYDASMDALLRLRAGIVEGSIDYGNLRYLFTSMARQQYFKLAKRSMESLPADLPNLAEEEVNDPAEYELFGRAWKQLGVQCRELLRSIYFAKLKVAEIAAATNVDAAKLRKQKQRCIEKVRASMSI